MVTLCNFAGCDREKRALGLCLSHYMQQHRGEQLRALGPCTRAIKDENGRECTRCGKYKPWSEYYNRKAACKPCIIEENTIRNRRYHKGGTGRIRAKEHKEVNT